MERGRPFCAEISRQNAEPLAATASRVDNWILVEYRGLWGHDAIRSSALPHAVKRHLRERARARPLTKLLFIRRTERRRHGTLAIYWGSSPERGACLYRREVERYEDLLELDFVSPGPPVDHPLLLVCTHGKHDPCCARNGRPLYTALRNGLDEDWVWQVSHIGGDRFAGNLVCLPQGLYFGRVGAADAWPLLEDYLGGTLRLEHYRGRSCYTLPVQAAERRVREVARLDGIDDVRLVAAQQRDTAWQVTLTGRECTYDVEVCPAVGDLTHLTCVDEMLKRPLRFVAEILPGSAA
jgi:hypothetical protein